MSETKIVRSLIPSLAAENRKPGDFLKLDLKSFAYGDELFRDKILEEAKEVVDAGNREELIYELADLKQAMEEYMEFKNISDTDILTIRKAKEISRGTYRCVPMPTIGYCVYVMNPTSVMKEHMENREDV